MICSSSQCLTAPPIFAAFLSDTPLPFSSEALVFLSAFSSSPAMTCPLNLEVPFARNAFVGSLAFIEEASSPPAHSGAGLTWTSALPKVRYYFPCFHSHDRLSSLERWFIRVHAL